MVRNQSRSLDLEGVSNLSITDHLPADLIRSMWLVQSLNIQVSKKQHELSELLCLSSIFDKLIPGTVKSDAKEAPGVLLDSTNKAKVIRERELIRKNIVHLKTEITRLFRESQKEVQTIIDVLTTSKEFLSTSTYYLIENLFRTSTLTLSEIQALAPAEASQYNKDAVFPSISQIKKMYAGINIRRFETNKNKRDLKQRPNNDNILNFYGNGSENIRKLIDNLTLEVSVCTFENQKKLYEAYQRVFLIMIKNRLFDKENFKNSFQRPKLKLIFKSANQASHENLSASNLVSPLSSVLKQRAAENQALLMSSRNPSTTPTTLRIRLTFKAYSEEPTPDISSPLTPFLSPSDSALDIDNAALSEKNSLLQQSLISVEHMTKETSTKRKINKQDGIRRIKDKLKINGDKTAKKQKEEKIANTNEDEELYCVCRQPSFGKMIACDNENCKYGWFHYRCIGLKSTFKPPKSKPWYCQFCSPLFAVPDTKHNKSNSNGSQFKVHQALVPTKADEIGFQEVDINDIIKKAKKSQVKEHKPLPDNNSPSRRTRSHDPKPEAVSGITQVVNNNLIAGRLRLRTVPTDNSLIKHDVPVKNVISSIKNKDSGKTRKTSKNIVGTVDNSLDALHSTSAVVKPQPISRRLRSSNVDDTESQVHKPTTEVPKAQKLEKKNSDLKIQKPQRENRKVNSAGKMAEKTSISLNRPTDSRFDGISTINTQRRSARIHANEIKKLELIGTLSKLPNQDNSTKKPNGASSPREAFMVDPLKSNTPKIKKNGLSELSKEINSILKISSKKKPSTHINKSKINKKNKQIIQKVSKPSYGFNLRKRNLRSTSR